MTGNNNPGVVIDECNDSKMLQMATSSDIIGFANDT